MVVIDGFTLPSTSRGSAVLPTNKFTATACLIKGNAASVAKTESR